MLSHLLGFLTQKKTEANIEQEKSRHPKAVQALITSIRDCYDTEEMALEQNQFRFKDFIDQQTGEVLVKLFFQNYHESPLPLFSKLLWYIVSFWNAGGLPAWARDPVAPPPRLPAAQGRLPYLTFPSIVALTELKMNLDKTYYSWFNKILDPQWHLP